MAELSLPRPYAEHRTALLMLLPLLLLGLEFTPADLWFSDLFFDPVRHIFPLKHDWWFETVLHTGGRWLVVIVGLSTLAAWASTPWVVKELRPVLGFIVLSMALSTGVVALIKSQSPVHCPYDLIRYGGDYQRVALFAVKPVQQVAGHCWPAGHASAGFSLWAFYFAPLALNWHPRKWLFWAPLIVGLAYGLVQTARGAHFLSHTLWTGCMVLIVNLLLVGILSRRRGHAGV